MQNTTTKMRECVGCKTTSLDNFEKHKKGVMFKTCMHRRRNDQDMTNTEGKCILMIMQNEIGREEKLMMKLIKKQLKKRLLKKHCNYVTKKPN